MRRHLTIPLVLALGALAFAGCGSSGSSSSSSSSPTPAPASTPATTGGGAVAVSMKNIAFAPKSVTVKVGQKITWTNDDTVAHNVTAKSGASFASSTFNQGGTYSYTPTKAGTISYVCTIHPGMDGTIIVTR
jgi:plastocyanin